MTGEHIYRYTDLEDRLLYEVVRRTRPDGKKSFVQRRPDPTGKDGWAWNLDGIDPVPYRWPWLDEAVDRADIVFVVEGEKDVERLVDLGLVATTSAKGASWVWPDSWAEHFRGAERVYVLADNDPAGLQAARQRAYVIAKTVTDVRILERFPDVDDKGDVSDWFDQGGTVDELWRLCDALPVFRPTDPDDGDGEAQAAKLLELRWVHESINDPPPEPPVLIDGMLRSGELAVIVAPRKVGKSWLSMQLAILIARGEGRLFGKLEVQKQCKVLLAHGELDPWGAWSRWRHLTGDDKPPEGIAESFDRWRISIETVRLTDRLDDGMTAVREQHEAEIDRRLERTIVEHNIGVLIVDPWAVFYAGKENSNDEAEAALSRLRELSMRTGVAVVIVHHVSKVTDVREPEDLWRGASRLADWASTGVTMMPHYKRENDWAKAGLTRQKARWFVDLFFMRRSTPTDDFSVAWNPRNGWWEMWEPSGPGTVAGGEDTQAWTPERVARACAESGGDWPSQRAAADSMGCSPHTAVPRLDTATQSGLLERYAHAGRYGWRVPALSLALDVTDPGPTPPPDGWDDDEHYWSEFDG